MKIETTKEQLMRTAKKHARLAFIYADDGAFATAAKVLREAAAMFEFEQARRNATLNPRDESCRTIGMLPDWETKRA